MFFQLLNQIGGRHVNIVVTFERGMRMLKHFVHAAQNYGRLLFNNDLLKMCSQIPEY